MKTITLAVILVFAISTAAAAANEPVLDFDGDEVRTGVEYYIVSSLDGGAGGGLALGTSSRQPCPEIVVQEGPYDKGTPVKFSNVNGSDDIVRLSTDVNIEFLPIRTKLCRTTTVWKVDNFDRLMTQWWVTTDGVKGNSWRSRFKIEREILVWPDEKFVGYKFRFCPLGQTLCRDIGRGVDIDGSTRLALTNTQDLPWYFKKVTRTASI